MPYQSKFMQQKYGGTVKQDATEYKSKFMQQKYQYGVQGAGASSNPENEYHSSDTPDSSKRNQTTEQPADTQQPKETWLTALFPQQPQGTWAQAKQTLADIKPQTQRMQQAKAQQKAEKQTAKQAAKQFVEDYEKKLWAARRDKTYEAQFADPNSELYRDYERYIAAKNDNGGAAFTAGFAKGTGAAGLVRNATNVFGNEDTKHTASQAKTLLDKTQSAHPIAGGAGYIGGKMAEYTVGKNVMAGMPGVGDALGRAGNAASNALGGAGKAGAAAAKFFTGERIAGLLGDQLLDTAFDTVPEIVGNVQQGKSAGEVAKDAAKNFAVNAAFNLGSEVVPEAWNAFRKYMKGNREKTVAGAVSDTIPEVIKSAAVESAKKTDDILGLPAKGETTKVLYASPNGEISSTLNPKADNVSLHMEDLGTSKVYGSVKNADEVNNLLMRHNLDKAAAQAEVAGKIKELQPHIDKAIAGAKSEYGSYKGQGVSYATTLSDYGVDGVVRVSNNEKWYSNLYKQNGRAPTKAEKEAFGEQSVFADIMSGGGRYVEPDVAKEYVKYTGLMDDLELMGDNPMSIISTGFDDLEGFYPREYAEIQKARVRQQIEPGYKNIPYSKQIMQSGEIADAAQPKKYDSILNELFPDTGKSADGLGAKTSEFAHQQKTSKVASNTYENTTFIDDVTKNMADLNAENKKFKYDVITEKESLANAAQRVQIDAAGELSDLPVKQSWSGEDTDTAMMLLDRAAKDAKQTGDYSQVEDLAKLIQERGTKAGQEVQAFAKYTRTAAGTVVKAEKTVADFVSGWETMHPKDKQAIDDLARQLRTVAEINRLSLPSDPDTVLRNIKKSVLEEINKTSLKLGDNAVDTLAKAIADGSATSKKQFDALLKQLKGLPQVTGDDLIKIMDIMGQAEKYGLNSKERARLEAQAYKVVADKFTSSAWDKWDAWRYMAMLGNARTHIRNVAGNTMFGAVTRMKDDVSALLQTTVDKSSRALGGKGIEKTTSILNPLSEADTALKKAAKENADDVYSLLTKGGKYNPTSIIDDQKTVFKTKALEALRKLNNNALEAEDWFALSSKYSDSLARYLKANGADSSIFKATDDASKAFLDKAQAYAVNEAQKATFRDANELVNAISRFQKNAKDIGKYGDTGLKRFSGNAANIAVEGVLPFKKTPANILMRAIEYSPANVINLAFDLKGIKAGTKTVANAMDDLASGLTGTGIMVIGYYMFDNGILSVGKSDNKKEQGFSELQGDQNYALNIGDKSYTLDWMAPAALPLFIGAELCNQQEQAGLSEAQDAGDKFNRFMTSLLKIGEPMLEMTMMQGLNSTLASAAYSSGSPLTALASSAVTGYVTQGMPTLSGQIARAVDDTRRTTYTDQTGFAGDVDRLKQRVQKKIPGQTQSLQPAVDQWGRVQNSGGGDSVASRLAYNMFSPGYYSENKTTKVDSVLNELYKETGDTGVLPGTASKTYQVKGVTKHFTGEQYTKYAMERGQTAYSVAEQLAPYLPDMEPELQSEIMKDAYTMADELGKQVVLGNKLSDKNQKIVDAAGGAQEYDKIARILIAYSLVDDIKGDKYPNGNTIPGSAQRKKMDALTQAGIDYPESKWFYDLF